MCIVTCLTPLYNVLCFPFIEYVQLDKQLDQLDNVLSVLEERNDTLHEKAVQFLLEAKQVREEQEKEHQKQKETDSSNNDSSQS